MTQTLKLLTNLIFFLPFFAAAQSNFQPAFIVDAKGDTIKGKIDYTEWESSPKTILFQPDGSQAKRLRPADIKFLSANVGHLALFESYAGPISTDYTDADRIGVGRDTSYRTDTVFLRVLQDGKRLKLFSYTDGIKTRYFIAESFSSQPIELVYRVYWNSEEASNGNRTSYETAYKGQLYDQAVKAGVMTPALKRRIQSAAYQADDLMKITGIINGINAADVSRNNAAKAKPARTLLVIIAALVLTILLISEFSSQH